MQNDMRCILSVRIFKNKKCFGPGIAELLEGVAELNSLRAAAAQMGMAYSKAWRILHDCEAELGFKLISSSVGGRNGGGAQLTQEGERLTRAFRALEAELNGAAQAAMVKWNCEWPAPQENK